MKKKAPILAALLAVSLSLPALASCPEIRSEGVDPAERGTALVSEQNVDVDGVPVRFEMYKLRDGQGGETNYIKLIDLAYVLCGTQARFSVAFDWETEMISLTSGEDHPDTSAAMHTPFSGDRPYRRRPDATTVNGCALMLNAFILTDDNGGDYTYYKLRDLGQALGFNVTYDPDTGRVGIETDKPYERLETPPLPGAAVPSLDEAGFELDMES